MYQEKYRIEFSGDIVADFFHDDVVQAVADLLHKPLEKTRMLFDGRCRNLATGLPEHEAIAYYKTMYDLGALCRIRIIMDRHSLEAGLIPGKDEPASSPNAMVLRFQRSVFHPALCSPPHEVPIVLQKGKEYGRITSLGWTFSTTFSILLTMPMILVAQYLFVSFYARLISNNSVAAILPIVLFFALFLLLPPFLQPRRHFHVQLALDDEPFTFKIRQKRQLLFLKQIFSGREITGNENYTLLHKAFSRQYDCLDRSGNILYRAEKQLGDEDAVHDAAETLSEELMDIGALQYIKDMYAFLSRLNIKSLRQVRLKANRFRQRVVIKDGKGTLVGTCILDTHCTITLAGPVPNTAKRNLIISLCLIISGN